MYNGQWLIKAGNTVIPNKYIMVETYSATPKQRQDLDPYRDQIGALHRNVVQNRPSVIKFETVPMYELDMRHFMDIIQGAYISEAERKFSLSFYDPERGTYSSEIVYMVQPEFPILFIKNGLIVYNSVNIEFIGY